MDVVLIDNYDSFTQNLVEFLGEAKQGEESYISVDDAGELDADVFYNDRVDADEIMGRGYDAIVISPGPGDPTNRSDVGVTHDILEEVEDTPVLGVCMGMEAMAEVYNGEVGRAPEPVHGKTSAIHHDGKGVYEDIPQGFEGGRYHSLVVEEVPEEFEETAEAEGLTMGMRHEDQPIHGVQFHPESVLTGPGLQIIENFLEQAQQYNEETR